MSAPPYHFVPAPNRSRRREIRVHAYWQQLRRKQSPMCEAWASSFDQFLADVGHRPYDSELVQLDSKLPHSPSNSRWMPINTIRQPKETKNV